MGLIQMDIMMRGNGRVEQYKGCLLYTSGFSFYAMRGGAKLVHSVDSSAKAIDLTNKNVELNFPCDSRHEAFAEDAFKYLDRMGDQYDLIILDPPAFAKHKDADVYKRQGYHRL